MICLLTLCEKYINMEFFLVRIFQYLVRKQQKTDQKISIFEQFSRSVKHDLQLLWDTCVRMARS